MQDAKCRKCRRAREKLFLRGEKCYSPKCPLVRKPYAPGIFGKSRGKHSRGALSEYGLQMTGKQKIKFNYGLLEKQFANYVEKTQKKRGEDRSSKLYEFLESRLDNALFRAGFAESRSAARQIVSHGHILVNGKKVNIPSCQVRAGDKISIRSQSETKGIFKNMETKLKKYNPPKWIKLDKVKKEAEIVAKPLLSEEPSLEKPLHSIIEFYSRA